MKAGMTILTMWSRRPFYGVEISQRHCATTQWVMAVCLKGSVTNMRVSSGFRMIKDPHYQPHEEKASDVKVWLHSGGEVL